VAPIAADRCVQDAVPVDLLQVVIGRGHLLQRRRVRLHLDLERDLLSLQRQGSLGCLHAQGRELRQRLADGEAIGAGALNLVEEGLRLRSTRLRERQQRGHHRSATLELRHAAADTRFFRRELRQRARDRGRFDGGDLLARLHPVARADIDLAHPGVLPGRGDRDPLTHHDGVRAQHHRVTRHEIPRPRADPAQSCGRQQHPTQLRPRELAGLQVLAHLGFSFLLVRR